MQQNHWWFYHSEYYIHGAVPQILMPIFTESLGS